MCVMVNDRDNKDIARPHLATILTYHPTPPQ